MNRYIISLLFFISITFIAKNLSAEEKFITGIGYIVPGEYRVDNEINPLPFGISLIPMIAYRGERLNVLGPNVNYMLLKGIFSLSLDLGVTGDRYKSKNIKTRDTAVNTGVTMRLLFLSIKYGVDISNIYNGSTTNVSIGWRFQLTNSLFFVPSFSKEFLSKAYVNYYYGISRKEEGFYSYYQGQGSENNIYGAGLIYIYDESNSFIVNYKHKVFDNTISNSPTISRESFGTSSFFWNYSF